MSLAVQILAASAVFFLHAVQLMVFLHVLISLVALTGVYVYVRPLEVSVRYLYAQVRRVVPTSFGPFDLAPVFVVASAQLLSAAIAPYAA